MITAILFILNLYAFGIIPFPNLYVTWFEHNSPATIIPKCTGTIENTAVYHFLNTILSNCK
jgi:hypothetical protein